MALRENLIVGPQLNDTTIHEAVRNVFRRFGFGPFDMEAIVYFVLRDFEVSPFTYIGTARVIREHIANNFECRRGSLMNAGELNLRRILVYYRE